MSTQIAVRLDDSLVAFVDAQVAAGAAPSRAALINRLLSREARRQRALQDIETMKRLGVNGYPDLEGIASVTARRPLALD